uniref:Glutamyl-tRNA(Gln) amidotransferase subunit C, mitochondrial n=1 Tax=Electrophorus electricus TaxID=8005 RepID=A0A4W4GXI1_ELEEL
MKLPKYGIFSASIKEFFSTLATITVKRSITCRMWFLSWKIENSVLPQRTKISPDLVDKLESLALVDFGNQEGVNCLEEAIRFADQLHVVNTDGVEPMDSVLENSAALRWRDDNLKLDDCAWELLQLATDTVEEYFVSTQGQIVGRIICAKNPTTL